MNNSFNKHDCVIKNYFLIGADEAMMMVKEIASDVLGKLSLSSSDEFEDFAGIDDHIREMSSLLHSLVISKVMFS